MKFGNFELLTGGKFNIEEILSQCTELDQDGNQIVHLTPELYDMVIEEWALKETKKLSDERIKEICNFYKGKYIFSFSDDYKPLISDHNIEDDGIHYMLADHVEFNKTSFTFTVFTRSVLVCLDNDCYPIIAKPNKDGFFEYIIPIYMNNLFIDIKSKDMLADVEEFMAICKECLINMNNTALELIKLHEKLKDINTAIKSRKRKNKKQRNKKTKNSKKQDNPEK